MRFVVDECTGPYVARWLRDHGYDVFCVYDQARGIDDDLVIRMAYQEHRVLITNDKGFGERIVRERHSHHGVILLRLSDETSASKITVLDKVLRQYANQVEDHFVVATETKIRISTGRVIN